MKGTLTMHGLVVTFGNLPSARATTGLTRQETLKELRVVQETSDKAQDIGLWQQVGENLKNYVLLLQLRDMVPSVMKLRQALAGIFVPDSDQNDGYMRGLDEFQKKLISQFQMQTLASLPALIGPIKEMFSSMGQTHMFVLSQLAKCDNLAKWLAEHQSTNEFDRLLQVCEHARADRCRSLLLCQSVLVCTTLSCLHAWFSPPFDSVSTDLKCASTPFVHPPPIILFWPRYYS